MGKDAEELSPYYYDYPDNTFDVLFLGSSVSKTACSLSSSGRAMELLPTIFPTEISPSPAAII